MPNIKSAAKRTRQSIKREERNRRVKSALKTSIRHFEDSLAEGDLETAEVKLTAAVRTIDKAAAKGVLHKNNAARKKSSLNRAFNRSKAV
ncbi:MAG: 30S ribosomal protein S20 [Bacillota bacterium]